VTITTEIIPVDGELPTVSFLWDSKTEILAGTIAHRPDAESGTRTIELGGTRGSYLSLDLVGDVLAGVEVVVWPQGNVVDRLDVPAPERRGKLKIIRGGSGGDPALVELGQPLTCLRTSDESTVCLRLADTEAQRVVAVADNLLAEVDGDGKLIGLWLLNVPPFPGVKKTG